MNGDHPLSRERLLALAAGELSDDVSKEMRTHLQGCALCAATFALIDQVSETIRADAALTGPSEAALERVQKEFETLWTAARGAPSAVPATVHAALRRIIASLTFDSGAALAWSGARGGSAGRHLAYESESLDVDIRLEPLPSRPDRRWHVLGQVVLRGDDRLSSVGLVPAGADGPEVEALVDEHGVFEVVADPGRWDLRFRVGETLVIISDLALS